MLVSGKQPYQGYSVGILLFEGLEFPMPPGDVGNATTYPFPVLLRVMEGLFDNPFPPLTLPNGGYTEPVQKCIEAAQQMEKDGVRALAMCCGFFSLIQPVIAAHVDIPVMTSPLMMIPIIHQMLKPDQSVVVVTADGKLLSNPFFTAVGADLNNRITVAGMENAKTFRSFCMFGPETSYDTDDVRDEVVATIAKARKRDPAIGLLCWNVPRSPLMPMMCGLRQACPSMISSLASNGCTARSCQSNMSGISELMAALVTYFAVIHSETWVGVSVG